MKLCSVGQRVGSLWQPGLCGFHRIFRPTVTGWDRGCAEAGEMIGMSHSKSTDAAYAYNPAWPSGTDLRCEHLAVEK